MFRLKCLDGRNVVTCNTTRKFIFNDRNSVGRIGISVSKPPYQRNDYKIHVLNKRLIFIFKKIQYNISS